MAPSILAEGSRSVIHRFAAGAVARILASAAVAQELRRIEEEMEA